MMVAVEKLWKSYSSIHGYWDEILVLKIFEQNDLLQNKKSNDVKKVLHRDA